jgi:hypothetical protein
LVHAKFKNENPTHQLHKGQNQAPDPSGGGTDEALLEIAPDHLQQQRAAMNQVVREVPAG